MKLSTGVRSLFSIITLVGLVLGLQACGGGGSSTTAPTDANPTGYYDNTGTATVDATTAITDLQGMINGDRFMMISDVEGLFYDGTISSITGNDFAANVSVFKDGQPTTNPNATISGTITEGSTVTGTLTGTDAGNGTFTLQYAANNNLTADLTRINRDTTKYWESKIAAGNDFTILEIDASGNIVSVNSANDGYFANCILSSGSFAPIAGTSLYNVTMNVTNCSPNTNAITTYSGLAASWTNSVVDDRLSIGVTDATSVLSINGDFIAQ